MKSSVLMISLVAMLALIGVFLLIFPLQSSPQKTANIGKETPQEKLKHPELNFIQTIPLPDVKARIDHMDIDLRSGRLYVAVLGSHSVEIIDLNLGKRISSIGGFRAPQAPLVVSELNRIFVTNGADGSVDIFDAQSLNLIKSVKFAGEADNIRYDPNTKLAYVAFGQGGIGIIDVVKMEIVGEIPLAGHPEAFQLEKSGTRIFANVPFENSISVIDREKRTLLTKWPVAVAKRNFPMAIDEATQRLFIGARDPDKLIVFDTSSGKTIANLDISKDADDIYYDVRTKLLYIACGDGFIKVIKQQDADHYELIDKIPTSAGARTGIFVSELNRFYVGVPSSTNSAAEIRVYEVKSQAPKQAPQQDAPKPAAVPVPAPVPVAVQPPAEELLGPVVLPTARVTLDEASVLASKSGFRVMQPTHLPRGFRLVEVRRSDLYQAGGGALGTSSLALFYSDKPITRDAKFGEIKGSGAIVLFLQKRVPGEFEALLPELDEDENGKMLSINGNAAFYGSSSGNIWWADRDTVLILVADPTRYTSEDALAIAESVR